LNYWRSPSYGYGNLFTVLSTTILAGFTFWKLGNNLIALQERLFAAFMFIFLPAPILNAVIPKFFESRMLWESRELPSRVYGWFAFTTANIVCEIPYAVLFAVIYFVVWYFPVGFPADPSTAGYTFFPHLDLFPISAKLGTMDRSVRFRIYYRGQCSAVLPGYGLVDYGCPYSAIATDCILEVYDVLHFASNLSHRRGPLCRPR